MFRAGVLNATHFVTFKRKKRLAPNSYILYKKSSPCNYKKSIFIVRHGGVEPPTTWLKVKCSTNWASIPYLIIQMLEHPNWASWIRTNECRSQSPVPYRLAIAHYLFTISSNKQGGYRDSNPGPPEPQSGALTNCAIPTTELQDP